MRACAATHLSLLITACALAACGGGGSEPVVPTESAQQVKASQPGELVAFVKTKLQQRQALRQASGTVVDNFGGTLAAAAPAAPSAGGSASTDNPLLQEAGVDEDNLIKADAAQQQLFTLQPGGGQRDNTVLGTLRTWRRDASGNAVAQGALALAPQAQQSGIAQGLYHADTPKRVAVLSKSWILSPLPNCQPPCELSILPPVRIENQTELHVVDVANPAAPAVARRLAFDGLLMDSRVIGNTLYVVSVHAPRLSYEQLPPTATDAERAAALAALAARDILPSLRIDGGAAQPLLAETDCYLQPGNASTALEITTITTFDLASPTIARASRCFIGGSEALYMTAANLYLATTRYNYDASVARVSYPLQITTDIHKFALDASAMRYRASGEVPGHLGWDAKRKSFRLSEHGGDLRVLSFTGQTGWITEGDANNPSAPPPSPATLTVLREGAGKLDRIASLPNAQHPAPIGKPGEQIYGVRFAGPRAFAVTFRQIDPLYVLDLSNASDPRVAGELAMPGFSSDLFLLPNNLLLGVGRDADAAGRIGGIKVALLDVADAATPRLVDSRVYGSAGSASGLDYARQGASLVQRGPLAQLALPLALVGSNFQFLHQGLQRVEVDTQARTLADKPFVIGNASGTPDEPWNDRALQTGAKLHYLSRGQITSFDW